MAHRRQEFGLQPRRLQRLVARLGQLVVFLGDLGRVGLKLLGLLKAFDFAAHPLRHQPQEFLVGRFEHLAARGCAGEVQRAIDFAADDHWRAQVGLQMKGGVTRVARPGRDASMLEPNGAARRSVSRQYVCPRSNTAPAAIAPSGVWAAMTS